MVVDDRVSENDVPEVRNSARRRGRRRKRNHCRWMDRWDGMDGMDGRMMDGYSIISSRMREGGGLARWKVYIDEELVRITLITPRAVSG